MGARRAGLERWRAVIAALRGDGLCRCKGLTRARPHRRRFRRSPDANHLLLQAATSAFVCALSERMEKGNLIMAIFEAGAAEAAVAAPILREAMATTRALVFPGQGSQAVGMGRELAKQFAVARDVFAEVDEALGEKLSELMADGPEDLLTLTENAQPALMAVSIAVLRVIEQDHGLGIAGLCRFVAGHSLGEYTALTAAGSFSVGDAARL